MCRRPTRILGGKNSVRTRIPQREEPVGWLQDLFDGDRADRNPDCRNRYGQTNGYGYPTRQQTHEDLKNRRMRIAMPRSGYENQASDRLNHRRRKDRNSRYRCRILARCASMVRHHRQSAHQQLGREGEIYGHHRKRFIRSIHDATRARRSGQDADYVQR